VVGERLVLAQALAALASSPATGEAAAALAGSVAAFSATAAKDEGRHLASCLEKPILSSEELYLLTIGSSRALF
jgi:hypothetical protein